MGIIEEYVDQKIEKLQNEIIKFTTTIIDNTHKPKDRHTLQTITNNTAKKLWRKQVKIIPLDNTIEIIINKMKENLNEIITNETQENPSINTHTLPHSTPNNIA